jgi:hypothetical protein
MPTWTCQKCGTKVENFSWGNAPWKSHRCAAVAEAKDANAAIPSPTVQFPPAASLMVPQAIVVPQVTVLAEEKSVPAGPANPPGMDAEPPEGFFQKGKRSGLSGFL